MAIKDQTSNDEYVVTETLADGTEVSAEFTPTENPDDPSQPASHMTFTETAPDGTETVTEAVITADGAYIVEEDSALENAVEAAFGIEIPDELTPYTPGDGTGDAASATKDFQSESAYQTSGADFNVGSEMFAPVPAETFAADSSLEASDEFADPLASSTDATDWTVDPTVAATDTMFEATDAAVGATDVNYNVNDTAFGMTDTAYGATDATPGATAVADISGDTPADEAAAAQEAAELADRQAHSQAATDAQNAADEFIAQGDYAAAAEAREVAEAESWEAGDDSMLSAYDAGDLAYAADKQEDAEYYNAQQAEFAQAGDYEAAREAASNSAYATGNADLYAGGSDHTGQADAEYTNMDNAVWQEGLRDDRLEEAVYHAEMGNTDAAEASLVSAAYNQQAADHYGDLGEHGGEIAVHDASSVIETGGTYESTYDASAMSSYDASAMSSYDASAAVDTGFDASVDMSAGSYDTTSDDTV